MSNLTNKVADFCVKIAQIALEKSTNTSSLRGGCPLAIEAQLASLSRNHRSRYLESSSFRKLSSSIEFFCRSQHCQDQERTVAPRRQPTRTAAWWNPLLLQLWLMVQTLILLYTLKILQPLLQIPGWPSTILLFFQCSLHCQDLCRLNSGAGSQPKQYRDGILYFCRCG